MFLLRNHTVLNLLRKTSCSRTYAKYHNPITRTWNLISEEIKSGFKEKPFRYPEHADVVVIGGGFLGLSVAHWLKTRAGDGLSVVVLEKNIAVSCFILRTLNLLKKTFAKSYCI